MGVHTFTQEVKCSIPAKRFFKAFVAETYDVLPKIVPHAIKSIEINEGDGGAGTIRTTHFVEGFTPFPHAKHKSDHVDAENNVAKYTLIEGAAITISGGDIESVFYDQKYEDTPDGGCIIKIVREWRTKGDAINGELVKAEEEGYVRLIKGAEDYLIAHPEVCAA